MKRRVLTVLPVFNEAAHVGPVLDEVARYADDVAVVDDGSSDDTPRILAERADIHIITHEQNKGYGAALRSAFDFAADQDYDAVVTIDCDGQHQPCLIPALADALFPDSGERVDIVSGSRYHKDIEGNSRPPEERRRINRTITDILNARLKLNLTDAFCGFKAYRVSALKQLDITDPGYAMPMQFWVQAVARGLSIVEFPVPLVYLDEKRSFGGSLDDSQRRMAYYLEVLEREMALEAAANPSAKGR